MHVPTMADDVSSNQRGMWTVLFLEGVLPSCHAVHCCDVQRQLLRTKV